ncbi:unnamed protein product [Pedinophyceae sp. YPF-701]|nr:unnamed protein product [Pedinophyceae sp. YPF-701]
MASQLTASCSFVSACPARTARHAAPAPLAVRQTVGRPQVAARVAVEKLGRDTWNNTYYPKQADSANVTKPWYIIDAEGQTLGRLASLAARVIRGKHLATYHPAMDMGCTVVVINADKVQVTGNKYNDKTYFRHTQNKRSGAGRPGGWKLEAFKDLQERLPERIIESAVHGMLPKGRLGRSIRVQHLKVYKGAEHPHEAQQPTDITHLINEGKKSPLA